MTFLNITVINDESQKNLKELFKIYEDNINIDELMNHITY